jgi:hypothetical protein
MQVRRLITHSIALTLLCWAPFLVLRSAGRDRRRLRCASCQRTWTASVYLGDEAVSCPFCKRLLHRSDAPPSGEAESTELASLWDVRLRAHDRVNHQPPGPAETGAVLEALELVLDGLARSPMLEIPPELETRVEWADFALHRALTSVEASPPPEPRVRGAQQTLEVGARTWTAVEEAHNGREAALTIAALSLDELKAALLAAADARVTATRRAEEAEKWKTALAEFSDWDHPEDLL